MSNAHEEFDFLSEDATTALTSQSERRTHWWTFAGLRANASLADEMRELYGMNATADNLAIKIEGGPKVAELESVRAALRQNPPHSGSCIEVAKAIEDLKFSECLPIRLAESMLSVRLSDPEAVARTLDQSLRILTVP